MKVKVKYHHINNLVEVLIIIIDHIVNSRLIETHFHNKITIMGIYLVEVDIVNNE